MPDAIIPMPDADSKAIGRALAVMLDVPFVQALRVDCEYIEDRLEDDGHFLLFDVSNPIDHLQKSALALSEAFPKKIDLLSLFPWS